MKLRSLLGFVAVLAIALVAMSLPRSASATTGFGPQMDIHVLTPVNGTNTVIVGSNVTVEESIKGVATDAYAGYNASFVYSSATLGGTLTYVSINDTSVPGFWAADLCLSSPPSTFAGSLPAPLLGTVEACSSTGAPAALNANGGVANVVFTATNPIPTAVHMPEPCEADLPANVAANCFANVPPLAGPLAGTFAAYTQNAPPSIDIQTNSYSCTAPGPAGVTVPATSAANPLCPMAGGSPFNSVAINVINPPPDISVAKTACVNPIVAGQPCTFTITVHNPSATTTATAVNVTDTLPAAFTPGTAVAVPATTCTVVAQVVSCGPTTIAPGGNLVITVTSTSLGTAGGTSPQNCATATLAESDPNLNNNTGCATVQILAPAVSWHKSPTSGNLWLCDGSVACAAQSVGQQTNTFTFDEVMQNQGDPNGLGGFSFDIHYDPTQYLQPSVDLSPAIALFAAAGRALNCSVTIPLNGVIHVACASTGPIGTGPLFTGNQVMAHVTLTPQSMLVEAIRPNKENGDVSTVKDDQVTVTNTCGQPLNDGTIQPIPGQPECQGVPLQGVGPGGVLTGNPNGGESTQTIRRLEGDVTNDCTVDIKDMQLEASKFGQSIGGLLYNVWFDVNSPLQHGDGEIDINDIQFVFGRFGSECSAPIPAQPAQPPMP